MQTFRAVVMGWTLQTYVKTVFLLNDIRITEMDMYAGNQLTSKYERQMPFNDFRIFSRLRSDVDRNCIGWFRRVRFYLFEMLRRASRECQNSERNNQNFLG